jgi:DNA modification methylase
LSFTKFFDGKVVLYGGDCLEVLDSLKENYIDSIVTDPPYHLASIVKRFGKEGSAPAQYGSDGAYARASRGFQGKQWDGGDVAFDPETWKKAMRVLKPGGYLLAFGASRNFHRMAVAIEDAGFEVRDTIMWLYGTGFPKSHDMERAINKIDGVKFEAEPASGVGFMGPDGPGGYNVTKNRLNQVGESSDRAKEWTGWGTALKPSFEPIIMARKALSEKSIAENVLKWGTGAINLGASKFGSDQYWPANTIHDGSDEVLAAFPKLANARFFYSAKANANDRTGSEHPTVKPVDLMRYLVRMVTPNGGTTLDMFAGSGSTGEAALKEGFNAILIEREEAYQKDITERMKHAFSSKEERVQLTKAAKSKKPLPPSNTIDDLFT